MNYFYQLISSVGVGLISFALSIFIARQVGASNFGEYSTALAIGSILAIGLDGGLRNLITREHTMASEHLNEFNGKLPQIAMGHSLMAALLASLISFIAFYDQLYLSLGIIWCFWGVTTSQFGSAILRGEGLFKTDSLWQLKQRVLTALFIATSVVIGYFEVWELLIAWAAGALCANFSFKEGFWRRPIFKPLLSLDLKLYRVLLPLLWIDLATTIYFRSDLIVLKSLKVSDSDIGQYSAAHRLVEAAILIASPFAIIIFRKVRLIHEERLLQTNFIIKLLLISTLFGFLWVVLIDLISTSLVQLVYGEQYGKAATLLSILGWMIVLLIPNMMLTQTALALNLEKSYALVVTLAAISNISLNFMFIPEYGTIGAAYTSIATELILLIGLSVAIFNKIKVCNTP